MEKINSLQFFGLLILFQIGSYVIFGFASSAKQDAWLVALLSTPFGVVLVSMYGLIYRLYSGSDMIQILQSVFGSWFGAVIGMVYIVAFVYVAGRVLRDFAELVNAFILPQTPLLLILFCLLFLCYLGLHQGIEVVGRMAEFMLFVFVLVFLGQTVFLISSGVIHPEFLLPIAHQKKEILQAVVPLGITVPFGETIAFLMFYHQLRQQKYLSRLVVGSVVATGVVLAVINILAVTILGPNLFARMVYPLLTAFQQVELGEFIESVDALVVVYIGIAAFFKVTVFLYSASYGVARVFRIQDYRTPLVPLAVLVILFAYFMARNVVEHAFVGLKWVPWVLWIPLFIIIPMLMLVIGLVRKGGLPDAGAHKT